MFDHFDTEIKTCIGNIMLALTDSIHSERERLQRDLDRLGWERHHLSDFIRQTRYGDAYKIEQQQWGLEGIRRALSLGTYSSPEYERLFQQRMAMQSPELIAHLELEKDAERKAKVEKIIEEKTTEILLHDEALSGVDAKDVAFTCAQDVEDFILAAFARELPDFAFDKRLSTKDSIVLSKPFVLHWKIAISIDRGNVLFHFSYPESPDEPQQVNAYRESRISRFSIGDRLVTHEKNRGFRKREQNLLFPNVIDDWTGVARLFRTAPQLVSHIRFEAFILNRLLEVFEAPLAHAFVECAKRFGHSSS
jgi:hypothetical protein